MDSETLTPLQLRMILDQGGRAARPLLVVLQRWIRRKVCAIFPRCSCLIGQGFLEREDLTQEVLVRLTRSDFAKLRQWSGSGPLRAYVSEFAYYVFREASRKCRTSRERMGLVSPEHPACVGQSTTAHSVGSDRFHEKRDYLLSRLDALLARLSELQGDICIRYIRGESPEEIARTLGKTRNNIDQHLSVIRRKLRQLSDSSETSETSETSESSETSKPTEPSPEDK